MRPYVLLSLLAIPLAAACAVQSAPDLDVEPGATPSAEETFFNDNVKPVFEVNCAGCHANAADGYGAPDFLGASPDSFYGTLTARLDFVSCDVGNSMLLLKGADPGHSGVPLAPGDVPKVQQWLEMEANARFGGVCAGAPPAPDPTPDPEPDPESSSSSSSGGVEPEPQPQALNGLTAMESFGDCMTYTDWIDTGMYLVANQQAQYNNNNTECYNCHTNKNTGLNYMPDPDDTTRVMEAFQTMRYMYSSFNLLRWTVNDTDGSFKDLVRSYRWRDKGVEGGDHPPYTLAEEYTVAYENWFDLTYNRWKTAMESGTPCDPAAGDPP